eukprot:jgi/Tetstr1/445863/TSEL_033503.t1
MGEEEEIAVLEAEALVVEAEALTSCWENGFLPPGHMQEGAELLERLTEFVGNSLAKGGAGSDELLSRLLDVTTKLSQMSISLAPASPTRSAAASPADKAASSPGGRRAPGGLDRAGPQKVLLGEAVLGGKGGKREVVGGGREVRIIAMAPDPGDAEPMLSPILRPEADPDLSADMSAPHIPPLSSLDESMVEQQAGAGRFSVEVGGDEDGGGGPRGSAQGGGLLQRWRSWLRARTEEEDDGPEHGRHCADELLGPSLGSFALEMDSSLARAWAGEGPGTPKPSAAEEFRGAVARYAWQASESVRSSQEAARLRSGGGGSPRKTPGQSPEEGGGMSTPRRAMFSPFAAQNEESPLPARKQAPLRRTVDATPMDNAGSGPSRESAGGADDGNAKRSIGGLPDDQIAAMLGIAGPVASATGGESLVTEHGSPKTAGSGPLGALLAAAGHEQPSRGSAKAAVGSQSAKSAKKTSKKATRKAQKDADAGTVDDFAQESAKWLKDMMAQQKRGGEPNKALTGLKTGLAKRPGDFPEWGPPDRHDFKMTDASRRLLEGRGCLSFEERNAQLLRRRAAMVTQKVDPEEAELAECTWRPKLNAHSLAIAGSRRRQDLHQWAMIRQDKLAALQEEKRRAKAASDLQGCTFKPQINAHSRRILERREAGSTYAHRHLARQMLNGALQHRAASASLYAAGQHPGHRAVSAAEVERAIAEEMGFVTHLEAMRSHQLAAGGSGSSSGDSEEAAGDRMPLHAALSAYNAQKPSAGAAAPQPPTGRVWEGSGVYDYATY